MKQAGKIAALLLALALVALAGCQQKRAPDPSSVLGDLPAAPGNSQAPAAPEKSLMQQGQELVAEMAEMAGSSQYVHFYTDDQGMRDLLAAVQEGDFSSPQAVYAIRFPEEGINSLLELAGMDSLDSFPQELQRNIIARAVSSMPTQLNAMGGADALAAASICTASKSFVNGQVAENVIYLYTYRDAVPAAVTFFPGEGGAVYASGMLILHDSFGAYRLEELVELLGRMGAEVETVAE